MNPPALHPLLLRCARLMLGTTSLLALASLPLHARSWKFTGVATPFEGDFVGMQNDWVVLQDKSGASLEFPFANFSPADQEYLRALSKATKAPATAEPGKPITSRKNYLETKVKSALNQVVTLQGAMEYHVTEPADPIAGSTFLFNSPDAFLFFDQIPPSFVIETFLSRFRVNGKPAKLDKNLRVTAYGAGTVVAAHPDDYPALTLFTGKSLTGSSLALESFVEYNSAKLAKLKGTPASFVLKRGYMATLAEKENGTGISRNFVAQDHDLVIDALPAGLDQGLPFVRVFPWRWTSKKGIAGGIWKDLKVGWYYDWNIGGRSNPDLEYVAIRQNRHWPDLKQDWQQKGITHLLGFNEPERPDQANMSVDDAIATWPMLLATGLRVGSPAPSDGGLKWLYEFMDKADAAKLRVDFVAVHYYRAFADPKDAKGAADQFYRYLKGIHDRVKRPIWITEWNNGANWTKEPDPNAQQQKNTVKEILRMLDETPFVERYALYNWVEEVRAVKNKDESLTPAGEVYRDQVSPLAHAQQVPGK